MTRKLPDHDAVSDALRRLTSDLDAAEWHGQLCGMLCVEPALREAEVLARLLPNPPEGEAAEPLHALWTTTRAMLEGGDFDFRPLLPDDDARLESRVEALGHWAQGFLLGLDRMGVKDYGKLPGELPGIAEDLGRIAAAERYALDDEEQAENAYMELVEYLRVAVQLFRAELKNRQTGEGTETIH